MPKQPQFSIFKSWIDNTMHRPSVSKQNSATSNLFLTRRLPLKIGGIIAAIALIALMIFLIANISFRGNSLPSPTADGIIKQNIPTPVPTLSPTPTPVPTLSPTPTPVPTLSPTPTPVPTLPPTPTPVPTFTPTPVPEPPPDPSSFTISIQGGFLCYTAIVGQTTPTPNSGNSLLALTYDNSSDPGPHAALHWSASEVAQTDSSNISCSPSPPSCVLNSDWISLNPSSHTINYGEQDKSVPIQTSVPAKTDTSNGPVAYCMLFQFNPRNSSNYFYAELVVSAATASSPTSHSIVMAQMIALLPLTGGIFSSALAMIWSKRRNMSWLLSL